MKKGMPWDWENRSYSFADEAYNSTSILPRKTTIMWENETDIPQKLCNRIKATID